MTKNITILTIVILTCLDVFGQSTENEKLDRIIELIENIPEKISDSKKNIENKQTLQKKLDDCKSENQKLNNEIDSDDREEFKKFQEEIEIIIQRSYDAFTNEHLDIFEKRFNKYKRSIKNEFNKFILYKRTSKKINDINESLNNSFDFNPNTLIDSLRTLNINNFSQLVEDKNKTIKKLEDYCSRHNQLCDFINEYNGTPNKYREGILNDFYSNNSKNYTGYPYLANLIYKWYQKKKKPTNLEKIKKCN